ncbi:fungal zn(2)-Cys(6) binuclear cluster domain-containing protein [Cordyceps javanica]|nr:fungal zn(2)-Cys(6) binuclear cluster domain-containing protein [Cordyceps javanica]
MPSSEHLVVRLGSAECFIPKPQPRKQTGYWFPVPGRVIQPIIRATLNGVTLLGCLTCRSKKVKCDEQSPRCRRCHRLELKCDWAKPAGRSRPISKAKPKAVSNFPKILPRMPSTWSSPIEIPPLSPSHLNQAHEVLLGEATNDLTFSAFYASDLSSNWGDWCPELGIFGSPLHAGNPAASEETGGSPSNSVTVTALW